METGHKTQGDGSPITGDINIDIKNIHNLLDNHITAINEIHKSINNLNSTTSKIDDLNKKVETIYKRKKTHLPKWVYWVWLLSIVALGLSIAALFIRVSYNWNVEFLSTAIILGFVGVLATFVVVSNYAQVIRIKDDCDKQVGNMREEFEEEFNKMQDEIGRTTTKLNEKIDKRCWELKAHISYHIGVVLYKHQDHINAFTVFLGDLDECVEMGRFDLAEVVIEVLIEMIKKNGKSKFDNIYNKKQLFNHQKHIEKALRMETLNDEIKEIIAFIENIKAKD